MMTVVLDRCELAMAEAVAEWRIARAVREGMGKGHGEGGHSLEGRDIPGATAEMATAKHQGCYWGGGANNFRDPDVGPFEVRGTEHGNGHLIVYTHPRKGDDDAKMLLLVTVNLATGLCRLIGTMQAGHAKKVGGPPKCKLRPNSPAQLWVEQSLLTPFNTPAAVIEPVQLKPTHVEQGCFDGWKF